MDEKCSYESLADFAVDVSGENFDGLESLSTDGDDGTGWWGETVDAAG